MKKFIIIGCVLLSSFAANAQADLRFYSSAKGGEDVVKLMIKKNAPIKVDIFSSADQEWIHTKVISSDITQEYMLLYTIPHGDTLELYRDIYFEKVVLKNNRNQKMTYWLDDEFRKRI